MKQEDTSNNSQTESVISERTMQDRLKEEIKMLRELNQESLIKYKELYKKQAKIENENYIDNFYTTPRDER